MKEFKYGDFVEVIEQPLPIGGNFWNGQTGTIIDVSNSLIIDEISNRYLLKYLVRLYYNDIWFLETNIILYNQHV